MNWIESHKNKWPMKSIWDFGRFLLSVAMAGTGIFLISLLIYHLVGFPSDTPLQTKVIGFLPFLPLVYYFTMALFGVFLRFRVKCKNEWDFWMIMLSFSLAGMFIMPVRKFIFHLLGFTVKTPIWIKILVYIPIIPPTYYVGLMIFGTILGQADFFWGMILKRLRFLTSRKNIKQKA